MSLRKCTQDNNKNNIVKKDNKNSNNKIDSFIHKTILKALLTTTTISHTIILKLKF